MLPPCIRLLLLTPVAWLAGCGGADDRVPVIGKLVDGSKPFTFDQSKVKLPAGASALPPGANPVQVVFTPAGGGEVEQASVNVSDGTFTVTGKDGKGIKPGMYKVAVTGGVGGADYFSGKFTPEKTQIVKEVVAGQEVVIDVSKPGG